MGELWQLPAVVGGAIITTIFYFQKDRRQKQERGYENR